MTLDEAIRHAEKVAEENQKRSEHIREKMKSELALKNADECETCADEHKQLAQWLRDYKRLLEQSFSLEPSATPTRKVGRWIYDNQFQIWRCSECNESPKTIGYVGSKKFMAEHFKFCNHCGAEMKVD